MSLWWHFLLLMIAIPGINAKANESSLYEFKWLDADKEVYVLQNRKYRKSGKFFLGGMGGLTTSGAFVDSYHAQARAGYFFTENFGFSGLYSYNKGEENSTAESVRNQGGTGSIPFRRITDSYFGVMGLWSPFYAKINTFNKIVYFDFILGLGFGQLNESNNRDEFESGLSGRFDDLTDTHTALMWQVGLKFYLSERWSIKTDLTTLHYQAQKGVSRSSEEEKAFYSHYDLSLGLELSF